MRGLVVQRGELPRLQQRLSEKERPLFATRLEVVDSRGLRSCSHKDQSRVRWLVLSERKRVGKVQGECESSYKKESNNQSDHEKNDKTVNISI